MLSEKLEQLTDLATSINRNPPRTRRELCVTIGEAIGLRAATIDMVLSGYSFLGRSRARLLTALAEDHGVEVNPFLFVRWSHTLDRRVALKQEGEVYVLSSSSLCARFPSWAEASEFLRKNRTDGASSEVLRFLDSLKDAFGFRSCSTQEGAYDRCYRASSRVVRRARAGGFSARVVRLAGASSRLWQSTPRRYLYPPDRSKWIHHVARVEGVYVDYTARQFDPRADFPVVSATLDGFAKDWDSVSTLDEFRQVVE